MKTMFVILFLFMAISISYADITYEKVDDYTIKITETKEIVTTDNKTPESLKEERERLVAYKNFLDINYQEALTQVDTQITEIDKALAKCEKLNIKEELIIE
jgi:hypothetical protein